MSVTLHHPHRVHSSRVTRLVIQVMEVMWVMEARASEQGIACSFLQPALPTSLTSPHHLHHLFLEWPKRSRVRQIEHISALLVLEDSLTEIWKICDLVFVVFAAHQIHQVLIERIG
jgi:hypothetical protein